MTSAEVPLYLNPFHTYYGVVDDGLIVEQPYNIPFWHTTPYHIHPSSWASLASVPLTTESDGTPGPYYSTIHLEYPDVTALAETTAGSTVPSCIQQPLESYTIQQYLEPSCPAKEETTAYHITPTYMGNQESHVNPSHSTVLNLNRAHSTPEPVEGRSHETRPRGGRSLPNKRVSRKRNAKVVNNQNGRAGNKLERNRLAAAKCRSREQNRKNALASAAESLEDQHRELSSIYSDLVEQVWQLKSEILSHGDCSCVLIQQYIKKEAQRAVDAQVSGESVELPSSTYGYNTTFLSPA